MTTKKRTSKKWTEEELQLLQENYMEDWEVLEKLLPNRTPQSMKLKMNSLGLYRAYTRLTDEELKYIKDNASNKTYEELAKDLGRAKNSIGRALKKLGLRKKTMVWELQEASHLYNNGDTIKLRYRLEKEMEEDDN